MCYNYVCQPLILESTVYPKVPNLAYLSETVV